MLNMGFEKDIRLIVGQIRPDKQTLLFSATWPKKIDVLSKDFLNNPIMLSTSSLELTPSKTITQHTLIMEEQYKDENLFNIINSRINDKMIIFVTRKKTADELENKLRQQGMQASCIHGDKTQSERDKAYGDFKNNRTRILIATDIAARGLDVKDINLVINYDFPMDIESYIHRIGRTGRAGAKGEAFTFITSRDRRYIKELIGILQSSGQEVPPNLLSMVRSYSKKPSYSDSSSSND